ncbi:MAG: CoA pyrophosphatase [Candidatus Bathyarchaeia archaeon]
MVNPQTIQKLPSVLRPVTDEQGANAAVALILKPAKSDYEILLVKRAENPKDPWSGQIALPGGKRDSKDADLRATVLRETREETGITLKEKNLLGVLNVLESEPRRNLCILPFAAFLEDDPQIHLSATELEAYMWVPYERIIRSETTVKFGFAKVAAYKLQNATVWGITHRILSDFNHAVEKAKLTPS